jgi:hypothetical protein
MPGGDVALLDCGQVKELTTKQRLDLAKLVVMVNEWQNLYNKRIIEKEKEKSSNPASAATSASNLASTSVSASTTTSASSSIVASQESQQGVLSTEEAMQLKTKQIANAVRGFGKLIE